MLYLNFIALNTTTFFTNLTLTNVVFEFPYNIFLMFHMLYLTLTNVVFEYNFNFLRCKKHEDLTLTNVVFE